MFYMTNKKQSEKKTNGKVWIKGTKAHSEVGLWLEGKAPETPEPLYKESRSLLRTHALAVGRDTTGQENLFSLQTHKDRDLEGVKYPRKVGVLAQVLFREWQIKQTNDDDYLIIKNLTSLANEIGVTPAKLKLYLIKLGGWTYPFVSTVRTDKKNKKKDILIKHERIFEVNIYCTVDQGAKVEGMLVGTTYTNFIRNYPVKEVWVRPCKASRESIGKDKKRLGLGNVFAPYNTAQIGNELGDMAYKLFTFSGSNKPTYKIGFDRLIKQLGITDDYLAKQGRVRVKEQIRKGLEELEKIGHLEHWKYNKDRDLYSWKYTNKFIKHKEGINYTNYTENGKQDKNKK